MNGTTPRAVQQPESRDDLNYVREEILAHNRAIYSTTWVILALMLASWAMSKREEFKEAAMVTAALGVGWAWAMARADYLIHRAGLYLSRYSEWENSDARLRRKELPILDALAILPIVILEWKGVMGSLAIGEHAYGIIMTALFLCGLGAIAYAPAIFRDSSTTAYSELAN